MTINDKFKSLQAIIKEANGMLSSLRKECPHTVYTVKYDSFDEMYWMDKTCLECGFINSINAVDDNGHRNDEYYKNHENVIS